MSPYIFVMCMERLSQTISKSVASIHWEPIKLGKRGPPFSHLFFADDLIIFSSTSPSQIQLIQTILAEFCQASGQVVSQNKSRIHFSANVKRHEANDICDTLQFQRTDHLGRYLGVPLLHSRVISDTYKYLIDKVYTKLSAWKAKSLSLAGRLTLAKATLSAIPFYTMQTSALPSSCCAKIEKIIRGFIWGSDSTSRKPSLVNWDDMCRPKHQGGCGVKHLKDQNEAFLSKLAVSLLMDLDKLWVKVMRAKYN